MKTNMKAAMQYRNKTPEEIVRQYKKRLRAKQGLLILIFLLKSPEEYDLKVE